MNIDLIELILQECEKIERFEVVEDVKYYYDNAMFEFNFVVEVAGLENNEFLKLAGINFKISNQDESKEGEVSAITDTASESNYLDSFGFATLLNEQKELIAEKNNLIINSPNKIELIPKIRVDYEDDGVEATAIAPCPKLKISAGVDSSDLKKYCNYFDDNNHAKADVDGDNLINVNDLMEVRTDLDGGSYVKTSDVDGNGKLEVKDLIITREEVGCCINGGVPAC